MNIRIVLFVLAFLPITVVAQVPSSSSSNEPASTPGQGQVTVNPVIHSLLMANKPEGFTETQWLEMMERPLNRTMYPLRITEAMLDTVHAALLDPRYQHVLIPSGTGNHCPHAR